MSQHNITKAFLATCSDKFKNKRYELILLGIATFTFNTQHFVWTLGVSVLFWIDTNQASVETCLFLLMFNRYSQ